MEKLSKYSTKTTAIVITTAMLTFVSHWRAAAVVLCDLGSSAFYACGIAEQAIGKAAPWFIIAIMCFSLCVRLIYMESCAMFVRGGVYRVVKHALGGPLGKISVSALLFDYSLTGPISAVAAGHYLISFLNQLLALAGLSEIHMPREIFVMIFAAVVILYFWHKNVMGIEESSGKSLRIVQLSSIMIGVLFVWSVITLLTGSYQLPPFKPAPTEEALGWLSGVSWAKTVGAVGVMIALGHSILAMSGEESLAQLYREIASPKIKNLKRAAAIIFGFSFLFTGVISLFAVMIIPDEIRPAYYDNLLSGLSMHLSGPIIAKMIMQGFIVFVGVLLLSGAVNTAFVGANGALNRLGEDGVFALWFRSPHKRYGTTHRFLTTIAVIQLSIVFLCRGDVYLLGEAYAFGVIWCFVSQAAAVFVLRWKDRTPREFTVPLNIKAGGVNIPIGIGIVFLALFGIAIANFFTKTVATKFGVLFTIVAYIILWIFERVNRKKKTSGHEHALEMVNLEFFDTADPGVCGCTHEDRILVAARDPNNLSHLKDVIERVDSKKTDILVMTVKQGHIAQKGGVEDLPLDERQLLTNIVALAEKHGTNVIPIMVPANDPIYATAKAAFDLGAREIVLGKSLKTDPEVQLEKIAVAWGFVTSGNPRKITVRVVWPEHELKYELN
jgi:amino acid transporter